MQYEIKNGLGVQSNILSGGQNSWLCHLHPYTQCCCKKYHRSMSNYLYTQPRIITKIYKDIQTHACLYFNCPFIRYTYHIGTLYTKCTSTGHIIKHVYTTVLRIFQNPSNPSVTHTQWSSFINGCDRW